MAHHVSTISIFVALAISLATASVLPKNSQLSNSTKQWTFDKIPASTDLIWYPCFSNYSCAMLSVPLDYSKPNGTRASIPLIMIAAQSNSTDGSYQGMLLTNPGGPGNAGVDFLLEDGYSVLLPVVGTNYDIVAFDPRGMGRSIPLADCSSSSSSKLRRRNFGLSGPELDSSYWISEFQTAMGFGSECNATMGGPDEAGPHMSTAVLATDMLTIVDAFAMTDRGQGVNSSSLLNYWGFSYGSFIGETFASMYPDRVGRVAIDGVVDPEDYISGTELKDIYLEDAVIDSFFTYCHFAGPSLCDFYTGNSSKDIRNRFENIFLPLNASYAFSQNWTNATTIQESLVSIKSTVRLTAYTPIDSFPILATQLVAYEVALSNLTLPAIEAASNIGATTANIIGTVPQLTEWFIGAFCGEIPSVYGKTYEELKSHIDTIEEESFLTGEIWATTLVLCSGWPITASWRFAGPFGGDTKNPILFISNTLDPATLLRSDSQKWAPEFKDAQILTIEAIGHTSMVANNSCANEKIYRFFQTGNLPGHDSRCVVEAGPFGVTPESSVVVEEDNC
ncbi:putative alpha beta-hydrolase protein [Botrytis fragariae]|uniref:Putative alpha beta-hydrolase protein n=1 Tax=Botrytis fragariae TaxID=1964551 RepID=A0A8H6APH6_9HELO|nr:putative alpha beta-hydrolase protein [Botrytis fragariae]KAF5871553.1 putative alpha beta-hydrolase protein [Botrytis fragariae]